MDFPQIYAVAAGWIKTVEAVRKVCRADLTHIVVGSFTHDPREGNTGGTPFVVENGTSFNSMGLPNPGFDALLDMLPAMIEAASGKTIVVSIAGFQPIDYLVPLDRLYEAGIRLVEINLGCPNVYANGNQKPIVSLSYEAIEEVMYSVQLGENARPEMRYWIKLSPTVDPVFRDKVARLLCNRYPVVGIVCSNTIPNGRPLDDAGKPLLGVAGGYGGVAGAALKPLSLINAEHYARLIEQYRSPYSPATVVIGCGGISSYRDVLDYQRVGCLGVQIGTAFFEHDDPRIFQQIIAEYADQPENA